MNLLDLLPPDCLQLQLNNEQINASDLPAGALEQIRNLVQGTNLLTEGDRVVARYGSMSVENGQPVAFQGLLTLSLNDDNSLLDLDVELGLVSQEQREPPETFKPLADFLEVTECLGELELSCSAVFVHKLNANAESRLALPSPLMVADLMNPFGPTHIEAVVLSRRTSEGLAYTMEVGKLPDDMFRCEPALKSRLLITEENLRWAGQLLLKVSTVLFVEEKSP